MDATGKKIIPIRRHAGGGEKERAFGDGVQGAHFEGKSAPADGRN